VSIPRRLRNSSQRKTQWMVEYCVCSDAIFGYHGRVDLYKANSLSLATGTAAIRLRTFRSRVPIPSRDCGDAPGVSSQPYLTMPSSPHAFKFDSPVNTPLLCFSPLTQCTTSPNLVLAVTTIPTIQSSSCHVTSRASSYQVTIRYCTVFFPTSWPTLTIAFTCPTIA
jgi:hypothetical protein